MREGMYITVGDKKGIEREIERKRACPTRVVS